MHPSQRCGAREGVRTAAGATEWVLFLEGGGWCFGSTPSETLQSCAARSRSGVCEHREELLPESAKFRKCPGQFFTPLRIVAIYLKPDLHVADRYSTPKRLL